MRRVARVVHMERRRNFLPKFAPKTSRKNQCEDRHMDEIAIFIKIGIGYIECGCAMYNSGSH
jgi:hypothetical protein